MAQEQAGTLDDGNDIVNESDTENFVSMFASAPSPDEGGEATGADAGEGSSASEAASDAAGSPPVAAKNPDTQALNFGEYAPLIRAFEQDPSLIDVVVDAVKAKSQPPQQVQDLAPPVPPQKPANYSLSEALSDPNSESFKYREAMESYRDAAAVYQAKVAEQTQRKQAERDAAEQRAELERRRNLATRQQLKDQFGMSELEIQDFMATMSKPEAWELGNLVDMYRVKRGQHGKVTARDVRAAEIQQRQARSANAAPPAGGGGQAPSGEPGEFDFGASLINYHRQRTGRK
jgi:hypothetical protein